MWKRRGRFGFLCFCFVLVCYWKGWLDHRESCVSVSMFGIILPSFLPILTKPWSEALNLFFQTPEKVSLPKWVVAFAVLSPQPFVQYFLLLSCSPWKVKATMAQGPQKQDTRAWHWEKQGDSSSHRACVCGTLVRCDKRASQWPRLGLENDMRHPRSSLIHFFFLI